MRHITITRFGYEKLDDLIGKDVTLYRENIIGGEIKPENYYGNLKKIGESYVLLDSQSGQRIEIGPDDIIMEPIR